MMRFNPAVYQKLKVGPAPYFEWIELAQSFKKTSPFKYSTFEEAYHHLMMALVGLQVKSLRLVKGIPTAVAETVIIAPAKKQNKIPFAKL